MEDSRESSATSSRRRRWELKTKESFESNIATDYYNLRKEKRLFAINSNGMTSVDKDCSKLESKIPVNIARAGEKKKAIRKQLTDYSKGISQTKGDEDVLTHKLSTILNDNIGYNKEKVICAKKISSVNSDMLPSAPSLSDLSNFSESRRKKKQDNLILNNSIIAEKLYDLKDDVIDDKRGKKVSKTDLAGIIIAHNSIQPLEENHVYHEGINEFVLNDLKTSGNIKVEDLNNGVVTVSTRSSHVAGMQRLFRSLALFCQGLLAGLTLGQCFLICIAQNSSEVLVQYTSVHVQLFSAFIFFLSIVCVVGSFDRCELGTTFSNSGVKMQWLPLFNISILALTLVAFQMDSVIMNGHADIVHSQDKIQKALPHWRWICISRSCLSIFAWIATIPSPHMDCLLEHLISFE